MNVLLIVIAVVLAIVRIYGVTHESFQAAAHLFVGGLFAAGYVQWRCAEWQRFDAMGKIIMGTVLSLVELACFIASHG